MTQAETANPTWPTGTTPIPLRRRSGDVIGYSVVDAIEGPSIMSHPWRLSTHGYAVRSETFDGKKQTIYLHREILNVEPGCLVDHINGDRLDNRRQNLRVVTASQNNANGLDRPRRSGFRGVYWHRRAKRWVSQISVNGRLRHLGLFEDPQAAARAYDNAAQTHWGAFARTNGV